MNRHELRRARELLGRARIKGRPWTPWQHFDREAAMRLASGGHRPPAWLQELWMNNVYIVMRGEPQLCELGLVDHLLIQTNDGAPHHVWHELQRIKDECLGADREAVEIFPPAGELVDDKNVYHLWVLERGKRLGFGLKNRGRAVL